MTGFFQRKNVRVKTDASDVRFEDTARRRKSRKEIKRSITLCRSLEFLKDTRFIFLFARYDSTEKETNGGLFLIVNDPVRVKIAREKGKETICMTGGHAQIKGVLQNFAVKWPFGGETRWR